jgi:hypothetical protein
VPEQPSRSVEALEQASSRAGAEQLSSSTRRRGVGAQGRGDWGRTTEAPVSSSRAGEFVPPHRRECVAPPSVAA